MITQRYNFVKCYLLGRRWRMQRGLGNNTDLYKIVFTAGSHNSINNCSEIKTYKTNSVKVASLFQWINLLSNKLLTNPISLLFLFIGCLCSKFAVALRLLLSQYIWRVVCFFTCYWLLLDDLSWLILDYNCGLFIYGISLDVCAFWFFGFAASVECFALWRVIDHCSFIHIERV